MHCSERVAAVRCLAALSIGILWPTASANATEPIQLFDGKSLNGWQGDIDGWEVIEGTLASVPDKYAHIYSSGEYSDFTFAFEFRLTPGANNGVALRAPGAGDPAYVGMESQILDDTSPKYADLQPFQYHGSIYGVAPAKQGSLKPVGAWNTQTITCRGSRVEVVLNGAAIVGVDLRVAAPDGLTIDGKAHPGVFRESGKIGLLGHGDRVYFRNVTVTPLD